MYDFCDEKKPTKYASRMVTLSMGAYPALIGRGSGGVRLSDWAKTPPKPALPRPTPPYPAQTLPRPSGGLRFGGGASLSDWGGPSF